MADLLLTAAGISLGLNLLFFLFAYYFQTDKVTDMTYSLSFIAIATAGLFYSTKEAAHWIVFMLILLWALRLGFFLMLRVNKIGRDDRFDTIRPYPLKFLGFWTIQAITCVIVSLAALLVFNNSQPVIDLLFIVGLLLTISG